VIVTDISLPHQLGWQKAEVDSCRLTFGGTVPDFLAGPRQKVLERAANSVYGELPQNYMPVRIAVSEKSYHSAVEGAVDALELRRGFWNLSVDLTRVNRLSWPKRQPVNTILLGPIHSVHKANGELADGYWNEPMYVGPMPVDQKWKEWSAIRGFESKARGELRNNPHRI